MGQKTHRSQSYGDRDAGLVIQASRRGSNKIDLFQTQRRLCGRDGVLAYGLID